MATKKKKVIKLGPQPDTGPIAKPDPKKTAPVIKLGPQPDTGSKVTSRDQQRAKQIAAKTAPTINLSQPQATKQAGDPTIIINGQSYAYAGELKEGTVLFPKGGGPKITYKKPIDVRKPETMTSKELPPKSPTYVSRDAEFAQAAGIPQRLVPPEGKNLYQGKQATPEQTAPTQYLGGQSNEEIEKKFKRDRNIRDLLIGDPLTHGKEDIRTGMAPGITPAGAVGAVARAATKRSAVKDTITGLKIAFGGGKKAATARITQTAETIGRASKSVTTQRSFIGQPARSKVSKLQRAGSNFATNTKTKAMTTSVAKKSGFTWKNALAIATVAGTYPFAHFELAEASDKLGIAMFKAAEAGDDAKVIELGEELENMLDPEIWEKLLMGVPFVNIYAAVKKNIGAARISAKSFVDRAEKELERIDAGGETEFEKERRLSDEKARARDLKAREEDTEYFDKQAKDTRERKLEEREEDEDYYSDIEKEKLDRKVKEAELWNQYYQAIADKDFALRDKILEEIERGF